MELESFEDIQVPDINIHYACQSYRQLCLRIPRQAALSQEGEAQLQPDIW
jgi:hypothetical protein